MPSRKRSSPTGTSCTVRSELLTLGLRFLIA
jgi:hypothetical protein